MKTLHFYADNSATTKQARPVSITILSKGDSKFSHDDENDQHIKMKNFVLYALGANQYALNIGLLGDGQKSLVARLQDAGAFLAANRENYSLDNIFINFDASIPAEIENIRWVLYGFKLGSYHYKYTASFELANQTGELVAGDPIFASTTKWANDFATGVIYSKELLNKPANIIYPETFVKAVKSLPFEKTIITVIDENELKNQGFGGLVGVSQGSSHPAQLLILDYHPQNPVKTIVFVGKGVTFDNALMKKNKDIHNVKYELGGAASVVGALSIIEKQKVPVRVIGLCGLVENIDSELSIRPGDVLKMLNQKSVEIISTDAEGRMVIADMLTYAQSQYNPDYLLDITTLTANSEIALGNGYSALMSNNQELVDYIEKAASLTAEPVWSMPMGGWYDDELASEFADLKQTSIDGLGSPSIAASFLEKFIEPEQKWAHIDITSFQGLMSHRPLYSTGGATAFGVLLMVKLSKLIANQI